MPVPEKEYFTLTELIKRWERSSIDLITLRDYARRDVLVFSIYSRDIGSHKREVTQPNGDIHTTKITALQFVSTDYIYKPIQYLLADDARRILESTTGEKVAVSVLYSSVTRNKESGTGYSAPRYFEPNDLLITRDERDKFEKRYNLKVGSKLEVFWEWVTEASNQKALTLIGSGIAAVSLVLWQAYSHFFG